MPLSREQFAQMRASGLTVEQIAAIEGGSRPQAAALAPPSTPADSPGVPLRDEPTGTEQRELQDLLSPQGNFRRSARGLPYVGGAIGGAFGGVIGAGAGGGSGEALRQLLIEGGIKDPDAIGAQTVGQGALEGGGRLLSGAVGKMGTSLARRAVGASKGLRKQFPGLEELIVKSRLPVGSKGTAISREMRTESAQQAADMINAAKRAGVKIDVERVAEPAIKAEAKAAQRALTPEERTEVVKRVRARVQEMLGTERIATRPAPVGRAMTPTVAQRAKRLAQKSAASARKARKETGAPVTTEALDDHIARGLRAELQNAIPGLGAKNAETQGRIGLNRAMEDAELNRSPVQAGGSVGPVRWGMIPGLAVSRPVASRAGLALNTPAVREATRQLPRGGAGLLDLLLNDEGENP